MQQGTFHSKPCIFLSSSKFMLGVYIRCLLNTYWILGTEFPTIWIIGSGCSMWSQLSLACSHSHSYFQTDEKLAGTDSRRDKGNYKGQFAQASSRFVIATGHSVTGARLFTCRLSHDFLTADFLKVFFKGFYQLTFHRIMFYMPPLHITHFQWFLSANFHLTTYYISELKTASNKV